MAFDVDFSPIGNLAKTYNDARTKSVRERTLAELGRHFADGNIDYRGLGAKLFALGEPRTGLQALQVAELREARADMLRRQHAPDVLPQGRNAVQVGTPPSQPAIAPQATSRVTPTLPLAMPWAPGVRRGTDGNLYVEDPSRPGKYLKVTP
jgi:hypothetical protein